MQETHDIGRDIGNEPLEVLKIDRDIAAGAGLSKAEVEARVMRARARALEKRHENVMKNGNEDMNVCIVAGTPPAPATRRHARGARAP